MQDRDDVERRVETNGIERTVREVLAELDRLDPSQRGRRLAALESACGVQLGRDEHAWELWLGELKARGVGQSGRLPEGPRAQLLPDPTVLADAVKEGPEDQEDEVDTGIARPLRGYRLLEEIGAGGMATVYRAVQLSLDRVVALKILAPNLADDESYTRRFLQEARLAATLSHPNIVLVHDAGEANGSYYLAMELVDGQTLQEMVQAEGPLREGRALATIGKVAEALEYARGRGLIHRDVKPANILIGHDGAVKLADLGLARAVKGRTTSLERGRAMGTPQYMAPEQCLGEEVDTRADVYSLGSTLYCILAGRAPFSGDDPVQVIKHKLAEDAPLLERFVPSVSKGTALIVRMAVERDRTRRYQTPAEMAADIADAIAGRRPRKAWAQYEGAGSIGSAFLDPRQWPARVCYGLAGLAVLATAGALLWPGAAARGPAVSPPVSIAPPSEAAAHRAEPVPIPDPAADEAHAASALPSVPVPATDGDQTTVPAALEPKEPEPDAEAAAAEQEAARAAAARHAELEGILTRASAALEDGRWDDAGALALRARPLDPDDKRPEDIRSQASRGRERERLAREAADRARTVQTARDALVRAERARREGTWAVVRDRAREVLAVLPEDDRAAALARWAEHELGLQRTIVAPNGMAFELVPAAEFTMGSADGESDERPPRRVYVDSFYISRTEVTNEQYGRFRPEHVRTWHRYAPDPQMPVICVSWLDAAEFCRWLSEQDGYTYRLPTEAEWEKAARGVDGRTYPWGDVPPDFGGDMRCACVIGDAEKGRDSDEFRLVSRVGSYPSGASVFGALDLAGNAWEWVADWYAEYPVERQAENPRGSEDGTKRVMRGGAFNTGAGTIRAANRAAHVPAFSNANVGFRVARSVLRPHVAGDDGTVKP